MGNLGDEENSNCNSSYDGPIPIFQRWRIAEEIGQDILYHALFIRSRIFNRTYGRKFYIVKIVVCTFLAIIAFAANSVLCRLALGEGAIDAASFTCVRLLSGISILALILVVTKSSEAAVQSKGSWKSACMLFIYATAFSFAYVSLDTGTGALVLFAAVQFTMIAAALLAGHKLRVSELLGMLSAFSGFVYLVLPSLSTPSLMGFMVMSLAGIAWGFYTLAGKKSQHPLRDTAFNFFRTLPFIIILIVVKYQDVSVSPNGIVLAVLSGAIASGIGYTIWYIALRGLTAIQAAVLQLLVPVIAAFGGILFANEKLSLHLMLSSLMILGGILMIILGRYYYDKKNKLQTCD
ncbi:MAG: DMT family transporter [Planctomycetes bacterium]|nr:DMT family transporter [Planctomycetota bacterium]